MRLNTVDIENELLTCISAARVHEATFAIGTSSSKSSPAVDAGIALVVQKRYSRELVYDRWISFSSLSRRQGRKQEDEWITCRTVVWLKLDG